MATKATSKKATKKSAPKTSSKSTKTVASLSTNKTKTIKSETPQALKMRRSYIILIIVMLALGAFLYYARGLFVAAVVNGQPISRLSIIKETEKKSGKEVLETIVRDTLIEQEARKANVTVSDQEVNDEIKKAEESVSKQGQKLDDILAMKGLTRNDLKKLIRLDKLVGKIVGRDVKVSDKEVADYIEKNKELLPQDQTEEQLKQTALDTLKQQKLSEKVQTWLESVQNKAKILYFVQY